MEPRTVVHRSQALAVRALHVEVIEGPDKGKTETSESESVTVGTANSNGLQLTDPTVSRFHLELIRTDDGVQVVDPGSTNGVLLGNARIERGTIAPGTTLKLGATKIRITDGKDITIELHGADALADVRGSSAVMRRLMAQVDRAAKSDVPIHLSGESGTGKEMVARALHSLGPRAGKNFVTVDCGSLSPTLVASELFGHEKGSFTGADRQHIGAFEEANGGTLFLDEVGELPAALQTTLLGVLERRVFRRVGGKQDISIDVRVVSATHRDLRAEINAGNFRLDLFYRMAVVSLLVPPLRERAGDIPQLIEFFLQECGCDGPVEQYFSAAAMKELAHHRWPGNVRELRNLVEATVAMGEAPPLLGSPVDEPPRENDATSLKFPTETSYHDARNRLLAEFEKRFIEALLQRTNNNVSKAAREAKMDRSYLGDLVKRHNLG